MYGGAKGLVVCLEGLAVAEEGLGLVAAPRERLALRLRGLLGSDAPQDDAEGERAEEARRAAVASRGRRTAAEAWDGYEDAAAGQQEAAAAAAEAAEAARAGSLGGQAAARAAEGLAPGEAWGSLALVPYPRSGWLEDNHPAFSCSLSAEQAGLNGRAQARKGSRRPGRCCGRRISGRGPGGWVVGRWRGSAGRGRPCH